MPVQDQPPAGYSPCDECSELTAYYDGLCAVCRSYDAPPSEPFGDPDRTGD